MDPCYQGGSSRNHQDEKEGRKQRGGGGRGEGHDVVRRCYGGRERDLNKRRKRKERSSQVDSAHKEE